MAMRLWTAGAMALALAACGDRADRGDAPEETVVEPAFEEVNIQTEGPVFEDAAYTVLGTLEPLEVEWEGEPMTVAPRALFQLADRAYLLSEGRNANDCHACEGASALHRLEQGGMQDFALASSEVAMVPGSGWGEPSSFDRVETGLAGAPVLVFSRGFTAQGVTISSMTLVTLLPDGAVVSEPIMVSEDNGGLHAEGSADHHAVEGEIVDAVAGEGFTMRYTGTETSERAYRYEDGRFVAAD
ncbi:hypothetical protein [Sphingomicrobium aestuariivivum]|uniref:hypothetical protein n=1 Tax=Sphingomicrobium aestuariivivum TaxID=1582356 RepID=UPI001FD6F855|nr:hypothetical protein [Sphingomicrobium aestuariivivum]MCJ8191485.1 hypothetical protein [Sphingomicrobium aestuariivivum]